MPRGERAHDTLRLQKKTGYALNLFHIMNWLTSQSQETSKAFVGAMASAETVLGIRALHTACSDCKWLSSGDVH
jgi:hypothetical protein